MVTFPWGPWADHPVKIEWERHRTPLRVFWAMWLAGVISGSLASGNEMSSLDKVLPFLQYDKLTHYGATLALPFYPCWRLNAGAAWQSRYR